MIITCQSCATRYEIEENLIKPGGSTVRCSSCKNVFTAYLPTEGTEDIAAMDAGGGGSPDAETGTTSTTVFENNLEDMIDGFDTETVVEEQAGDQYGGLGWKQPENTTIVDFHELRAEKTTGEAEAGKDFTGGETIETEEFRDMESADFGLEEITEEVGDAEPEVPKEPTEDLDTEELNLEDDELSLEFDLDSGEGDREYEIDLVEQEEVDAEGLDTVDFGLELEGEESPRKTDDSRTGKEKYGAADSEEDLAIELDFDLEDEEPDRQGTQPEDEDDFELVFDLEDEDDFEQARDGIEAETYEGDEFDLTDVEEFLDLEEENRSPDSTEGDSAFFDLGLETDADTSSTAAAEQKEFDIDLETVREETAGAAAEERHPEKGAVETFGESGEGPAVSSLAAETGERSVSGADKAVPLSGTPPAAKPRKTPASKVALLVVLFFAIAAAGYYYMQEMQGDVPPPSPPETAETETPAAPVAEDPDGKLRMAISTPGYMFVSHSDAGEILVVTGLVTNRYDHPRSQIQVQGNLYDGTGNRIRSSNPVVAGVTFDAERIPGMPLSELEEALAVGEEPDARTQIGPDESTPFMLVFSHLPDEAEEMDVEVVASAGTEE